MMPSVPPLKLKNLRPGLLALWARDRDPFLSSLRWRLHLRLLLISAALSLGFVIHNLINARPADRLFGVWGTFACLVFPTPFPNL